MNLIVAVDENWAIGYKNSLLARISPDLKRFKELTLGHPVLLGRKTLETFPGGRPLPGRANYILSANPDYAAPEGAVVLRSLTEAESVCPADTFVIGGDSVYRAALPLCDTAYVTQIGAVFPADAWMPNLDADGGWTVMEESAPQEWEGVRFRYLTYKRKKGG